MTLRIIENETPTDEDRAAILAPLRVHNLEQAGDPRIRQVALLLTDATGERVGGLWGRCSYDWMFVELLAVPEHLQGAGYGQALLAEAERIARDHGCVGIWLDTFEFQARGFYEKQGFALFGTIEDHPIGQSRFFLKKRLVP